MRPLWIALASAGVVFATETACSSPASEGESTASAVAVAGRWRLPDQVRQAGAQVRLAYDGAPRWTGTGACSGRLRTGARRLGQFVLAHFAGATSVGGYACRRNTADSTRMSVHGTGRAMDIFIPKTQGEADNGKGDEAANWFVEHAQEIGVQLVIWDRSVWRGNGTNESAYGGPHPHDDHLHVELTTEAGDAQTPWFRTNGDFDAGDDDGGTDVDAGEDPSDDDGGATWEDDQPADHDAATGAGSSSDSGSTAKVDAGARGGTSEIEPLPKDDPSGSNGWEMEEGEDGPGERDSLGKSRPASKRAGASDSAEEPSNGGCHASRGATSRAGGPLTLAALAALAARARRRRTQDEHRPRKMR